MWRQLRRPRSGAPWSRDRPARVGRLPRGRRSPWCGEAGVATRHRSGRLGATGRRRARCPWVSFSCTALALRGSGVVPGCPPGYRDPSRCPPIGATSGLLRVAAGSGRTPDPGSTWAPWRQAAAPNPGCRRVRFAGSVRLRCGRAGLGRSQGVRRGDGWRRAWCAQRRDPDPAVRTITDATRLWDADLCRPAGLGRSDQLPSRTCLDLTPPPSWRTRGTPG